MRATFAFASVLVLCASAQADPVHDALEDYALYQNDVSALLDVNISSGRVVDAALARMQRHNPASVARGWIAYGALTAAQSPEFVAGIERSVRDDGRAAVMGQLQADPGFARRQNGSDQAIRLILTVAGADGARAGNAGERYDQYARIVPTVQLVSSTFYVDLGGSTRLSQAMHDRLNIGAGAARPASDAEAFGGRRFWDSLAGRDGRSSGGRSGGEDRSYASVTDRMLTLAAVVAAGGEDSSQASALLDEPLTRDCMHMQQLQLRQCLSVTHDAGERAYCMGHHALEGPGACFANVVH